jgi:hypothetical protein
MRVSTPSAPIRSSLADVVVAVVFDVVVLVAPPGDVAVFDAVLSTTALPMPANSSPVIAFEPTLG